MINTKTNVQHDVEQELRWDPRIQSEKIGVTVKAEVVQLDGQVNSFFEKWAAEDAALRVSSVHSVANEIKVDMLDSNKRSDADIAQVAQTHLGWSLSVPSTVKTSVSDGCVTLQGEVEWQFQKAEAERIVRPMRGVKMLINNIVVRPEVEAAVLKEGIVNAFGRSAALQAKNIQVDVSGSRVTLRGHVHSWLERVEAHRVVWADPAVSDCVDLLTYSPN